MSGGPFSILGGVDYMDAMANPDLARQYVAQPQGILGGFNQFATENAAGLLGLGAGLLSGDWGAGAAGFAQGMAQDERTRLIQRKEAEYEQKKVAAQQWAQKNGFDPAMAAADPDGALNLAQSLELKKRTPKEYSPEEAWLRNLQKSDPAKFGQLMESKFAPKSTRQAPSGYEFNPDGSLRPMTGGPQDPDRDITEPLPAELGAKIGLANQYFERFPRIEADLMQKDPNSAGPIDWLGYGEAGAAYRDLKVGTEAMTRMLTGAGMSQSEAENEVRMYLPKPTDRPEDILDKQYRLRASLRDMQREALRGRRSNRQIEKEYPRYETPSYGDIVERRKGALGGNSKGAVSPGASDAVKARAGALKQKYGLE